MRSRGDAAPDLRVLGPIFGSINLQAITPVELAEAKKTDETLSMVVGFVVYGWPKDKPDTPKLRAFFNVQQELSLLDGCIFRGLRAV